MKPRSRKQRLWQLLEQFPRKLLYRIGRAARASVDNGTRKHDVIETLCAQPEAVLEQALVEGLARPDLQALCERINRASHGSKAELAARILAAVDEPAAHVPRWRPFAEARAFAHHLELTSRRQWYEFVQGRLSDKGTLPTDMPRRPHAAYAKTGWTTWADFLGTGNPRRHANSYRPFHQARAFARSLGLANLAEWRALAHSRIGNRRVLPPDIPAAPHKVYADRGWVSYGDWLGTGRVRSSNYRYRSYEEACAFVRALGILSQLEWYAYCRGDLGGHGPRPLDIPSAPDRAYRGRGWVSWGQFFGTNSVAPSKRTFRSFAAARAYVRKQGFRDEKAWRAWCASGSRPADIPALPYRIYRGRGWVSWGDFLGTDNVHPGRVHRRSFATMRAFVRRLGLRSSGEYQRAWHAGRIPKDILLHIEEHPEWKGWADFLGPSYTGRRRSATRPARKKGVRR